MSINLVQYHDLSQFPYKGTNLRVYTWWHLTIQNSAYLLPFSGNEAPSRQRDLTIICHLFFYAAWS